MERAAESPEQQAARRLRIGARILLYALALGLIVVFWHQHQSSSAESVDADMHWTGVTSERQSIQATTSGLLLRHLDTTILERCPGAQDFTFHWFPDSARFVQRGRTVRAQHVYAGNSSTGAPFVARMRFEGYVGARPVGTLYGDATVTLPGRTMHCYSGPVTFVVNR